MHPRQDAHTSHLRTLSKIFLAGPFRALWLWKVSSQPSRTSDRGFRIRHHLFANFFAVPGVLLPARRCSLAGGANLTPTRRGGEALFRIFRKKSRRCRAMSAMAIHCELRCPLGVFDEAYPSALAAGARL